MIQRTMMISLLMLLGLTSAARAEGTDPAAPVAPLIDNLTLAVVRIDVPAVDIDAAAKWLEPAVSNTIDDPDDREAAKKGLADAASAARKWKDAFTKAGGKTLWLLVSLDAFPNSALFAVVPIESGTDERAMREVFQPKGNPAAAQPETIAKLGDNLVVSLFSQNPGALARLREIKPVARPEIGKAFAGAGDAKIKVAVAPSYDARRVIEAVNPKLPDGTPTTVLTHGIVWASAGIQPPPGMTAHVIVHSQDPQSAEALDALVRRLAPEPPKEARVEARMYWRRILDAAHVNGDQLTLDLDKRQASALGELVAGGLVRARTQASRIRSASNIRQMLMVCIMYANDHKGEFPPSLEDEAKKQDLPPMLFVNPEHPGHRPGYVYIRPAEGTKATGERLVIYGAFKQWSGGTNVGFADGHCEWINDQPTFENYLKDAQAHAAK